MIAVIDYGMGNLRSVQKALERAGGDAVIVQAPDEVRRADKVVLPGVGAFGQAIERLRSQGLCGPLVEAARGGKPFLGICLGYQLLFEVSYELGEWRGLGIFPGKVLRFDFAKEVEEVNKRQQDQGQDDPGTHGRDSRATALRVPHMGWNSLSWSRPCPLLAGVPAGAYVYFAHSYYVAPADAGIVCTTTDYGGPFASSVWKDNVFGAQFHPEKSQAVGLRMLENFVRL